MERGKDSVGRDALTEEWETSGMDGCRRNGEREGWTDIKTVREDEWRGSKGRGRQGVRTE